MSLLYSNYQIWNLFEGGSLFSGQDPEFHAYRSRMHLAEIIRLLGPPPPELLARGNLTQKFFSEKGILASYPDPSQYLGKVAITDCL